MKEILEVKAQGHQLVWKVNAEIKPNTEVFAHGGVQGIVVYDGAPLDHIAPGERKTINTKRLFERKNSGVFELYGVNTGKLIELNWGTRNSGPSLLADTIRDKKKEKASVCVLVGCVH